MSLFKNRWLVLAMALIASATMGILYSWSVFVAPLEQMFGWTRPQTTLTFSLIMVFMSLGMFTGGKIMAAIGPVKTEMLGGVMLGAGFFLASFTQSLLWLYATYGCLAGYGLGMANIVPVSAAMRWFPDKKGLVSGLVTMFLALGTFVLGGKLAPALIASHDVVYSFRILGILFIAITVVAAQFFAFPAAAPGAGPKGDLWGVTTGQMLATAAAWVIIIWGMSIQIGGLMIIGHIVPYAQDQGVSLADALLAMTVYSLGNGVGRLFHGWLHDACGRRVSMACDAALMLLGLLALRFLPGSIGFAGLLLAVVPVSMAYGGTVAHYAVLAATFFGPKHFGANYGFYAFPGALSALIGAPLAAFVLQATGGYAPAIIAAAAVSVIGLIAAMLLKQPNISKEA